MPKTNNQKQTDHRARQSAGGLFKRRDCHAHPDDWPKLRELEAEMRKRRLLN